MKVAEALIQLKDLKGKAKALQSQMHSESTFEKLTEESVPSTDHYINQYDDINCAILSLKNKVALTNAKSGAANKIHEMEQLRSFVATMEPFSKCKQQSTVLRRVDYEGPATPVTTYSTFNVEALNQLLDAKRKRLRELDLELQRLNWEIDLEK